METLGNHTAGDGEEFAVRSNGGDWLTAWHPPIAVPAGTPHGANAFCVTADDHVVLIHGVSSLLIAHHRVARMVRSVMRERRSRISLRSIRASGYLPPANGSGAPGGTGTSNALRVSETRL